MKIRGWELAIGYLCICFLVAMTIQYIFFSKPHLVVVDGGLTAEAAGEK